ncbi:TetR/AcrR family transcriptional regulator [Solimonas sp. K1W22B-7]|nr:TetR/AcrR family transcriptional regulator [Solimonas sp. K1W22B-7]
MKIRERQQREFDRRERLFMDCARQLIVEEGLLNLQMTRIAERCEYAVGTVYRHFASKEDLLLALTAHYTRQHVGLFQRVSRWHARPRDRMFALGVAHMISGQRYPEYFRLIQYVLTEVVWRAATVERRREFLRLNQPLGELVVAIVDEGVQAGDLLLQAISAQELAAGFWALATGIQKLANAQGIHEAAGLRDPHRAMFRHMQVMLNGYGWKPRVDPADTATLDRLVRRVCAEVFGEDWNPACSIP